MFWALRRKSFQGIKLKVKEIKISFDFCEKNQKNIIIIDSNKTPFNKKKISDMEELT